VFLLDEAEKAHPDVWRPFLNLFDEGWIVDRRGVKAYGDRAFFILTSNVGSDIIADMSRKHRPMREIAEAIEDRLRDLRHRSGQAVFPPEFLSRIGQIVVFRPLDRAAVAGICRIQLAERRRFWRDQRDKELIIPDTLVEHITGMSHALAETKGGRAARDTIPEFVDDPIAVAASHRPDDFRRCSRIELTFRPLPGGPEVEVEFGGPAAGGHPA
jgi:ATP-dependent Clp protease ATP-binding subunit ClpC